MNENIRAPRIWDLLNLFKESCNRKGWETSEYEDLVKINGIYHGFIGTRGAHSSTFKKIVSKGKRAIKEGQSYRVVDVSYTAWVFEQPPSKELIEKLLADPELSKKTAMYDLSGLSQGKTLCLKLNETNSKAFMEFERFLKEKYGITTRPLYEPQTKGPRTFKSKLEKASVG